MAKKKNTSKKHKFKHVETAAVVAPGQVAETRQTPAQTLAPAQVSRSNGRVDAAVQSGRDFSYVSQDLRRIGILAGSLVLTEFILYYLLVHTSLGASVYSLVKI